jgi:hypothetical protein
MFHLKSTSSLVETFADLTRLRFDDGPMQMDSVAHSWLSESVKPARSFASKTKPRLPTPRGPLTETLHDHLQGFPHSIPSVTLPDQVGMTNDDAQLALHICYGLHYDGFAGVDDRWEWHPSLLALRAGLEERFLASLHDSASEERPGEEAGTGESIVEQVRALLAREGGPSLSTYMATVGSLDDFREFVVHRSVYQRKEADPHTWGIPRLRGRAKSAMVTLQADEYGGGVPGRSHAELFATTMTALDLDPQPGAYIDRIPAVTLATDNLVSLFGLHRRWRGALVGHLAAFEMTSVIPMSRYAKALRRLLGNSEGAEFYDVHVEADARHEIIAADDLILGLADSDPEASRDIVFGVSALLQVENCFSGHLFDSWSEHASSLLAPLPTMTKSQPRLAQSFLRVLCLEEPPFQGQTAVAP